MNTIIEQAINTVAQQFPEEDRYDWEFYMHLKALASDLYDASMNVAQLVAEMQRVIAI